MLRQGSDAGPSGWLAPESGRYYAGVENFGGHSGSYTLTITVEEDSAAAASLVVGN